MSASLNILHLNIVIYLIASKKIEYIQLFCYLPQKT